MGRYDTRGPTEAQKLLDDMLHHYGLDRSAIAAALGTNARVIRGLINADSPGHKYLPTLRALHQNVTSMRRTQVSDDSSANLTPDTGQQPSSAPDSDVQGPSAPHIGPSSVPVVADISAPAPDPEEPASAMDKVKGGLRDFLLGKNGATAVIGAAENKQSSKSGGSLDERQARFVEQTTPILALLVVIAGDLLVSARYRPVVPTHQEADAIMRPIVRLAARQLEIAGQLSDNTIDLLASFAALAVYGDRAWHTYKAIRDSETETTHDQQPTSGPSAGVGAGGGYGSGATARPYDAATHSGPSSPVRRSAGATPRPDAGPQGESGRAGHDERIRQHNALLDSVLAADAVGRRQLGVA